MKDTTKSSVTSDIDLSATNQLPKRGDELMRIVTRFEFALKETGFCQADNNDAVSANWDKFSNDCLRAEFFEYVSTKKIAKTILKKLPSKQILFNSQLAWENCGIPNNVQELLGAVRRVRNNLVHGGKSGDIDSDRNDALVSEAIAVLLEALKEHHDLRIAFESRY
jgi:hypothetical protein